MGRTGILYFERGKQEVGARVERELAIRAAVPDVATVIGTSHRTLPELAAFANSNFVNARQVYVGEKHGVQECCITSKFQLLCFNFNRLQRCPHECVFIDGHILARCMDGQGLQRFLSPVAIAKGAGSRCICTVDRKVLYKRIALIVDRFALCTVNHNIFCLIICEFCWGNLCAICNCLCLRKFSDDLCSLCYAHVFI